MTTHTTTRTNRPATQRAAGHHYRDHAVTGTPAQLANLIANHRNAGTLVALTPPRPVGDHFQMVIRLREHQPTRPTVRVESVGDHARTRASRPRRTRISVIVTAVTSVIAGLVTAAAYLVGQLVELITTHAGLILGVLALAAVLAAAAARRTSSGRHCPGC
jgi:hypothetical protein